MKTEKKIFALGFFDGVHLGHQALLGECVRLAGEAGVQASAITFDRHPQALFVPDPPPLINTAADREKLLRQYGMGTIRTLPVTQEVMSTPWRTFVQQLLDEGAVGFVCGEDFRFGFRGEGNAEKLHALCRELDLPCQVVPQQTRDGLRISSTHIRALIEAGEMEKAVEFLGHPHLLTGTVHHGKALGRTLGIPTANLLLPPETVMPRRGVYACRVLAEGRWYAAVTNVGTRPTVAGQDITVEPWILDFSGDLYGREITLAFYEFLRPEEKFPDLTALQQAIQADAGKTRQLLPGKLNVFAPCTGAENQV